MEKYICMVCQAEFDYRCPDGPDCNLSHPCIYCQNEVEPKHTKKLRDPINLVVNKSVNLTEEVTVIDDVEITRHSYTEHGTELDGYIRLPDQQIGDIDE